MCVLELSVDLLTVSARTTALRDVQGVGGRLPLTNH